MSFYEPPNRAITAWRARFYFLQTIRQCAPEVLEELHELPFDYYRIALVMNRWNLDDNINGRLWEVFESDPYERRDPSILDLRESLRFWAETFNLKDEWCLEKGFRTIEFWYKYPQFENSLMWAREAVAYFPPVNEEEGKFNFSYEKWDPVSQNRDAFQKKVEAAYRRHLIAYCDRIEELARERGFIEQKLKRDLSHFEWLVWYQVKNRPQSEICRRFNASRTTVAEGIKDVASMCGLTLRPPNARGRPRKTVS